MTLARLGELARNAEAQRIIRFGVVGLTGTAVYLAIAISLPAITGAPPTFAAVVASIVSVAVSYLGHHKFTFTKVGEHGFYLPRFLALSATLSCGAAIGTYVMTEMLHLSNRFAAVAVAVGYPIASFIFNRLVIFRDRH